MKRSRAQKPRISKKKQQKIKNSAFGSNGTGSLPAAISSRQAGAGSCTDLGSSYHVNLNPRVFERRIRDAYALYKNTWEGKKIINIPVFDILRNGWNYEGLSPEDEQAIINENSSLHLLTRMKEALRLERLVGGSVIFLGVSDGAKSAAEPLIVNSIRKGDLKFINTISRHRIADVSVDDNPLSKSYGNPDTYLINGQKVHKSRLIIFDGDPLTQSRSDASLSGDDVNDGFGESVLTPIYYEIIRAIGTRQAAFQLVNKSGQFFIFMEKTLLEATKQGQLQLSDIEQMMADLSAYQAAIINSDVTNPAKMETISPNFASIPELVDKFLQVLSAASDIPATRFLGQAPGGLNATGESDLENYYGRLESEQELMLKPKLEQLLEVVGRSALGDSFSSQLVKITFDPLWSLSQTTLVNNDKVIADKYVALVQASLLSSTEGKNGAEQEGAIPSDIAMDNLLDESTDVDVEGEVDRLKGLLNDNSI